VRHLEPEKRWWLDIGPSRIRAMNRIGDSILISEYNRISAYRPVPIRTIGFGVGAVTSGKIPISCFPSIASRGARTTAARVAVAQEAPSMAAPSPSRSSSTRPPSRRSDAREKLLVAGTRLIADHGIDAINTNVIARAARVGVGTFYGHFDDKHALHRAVVARALEVVRQSLADAHREVADRPLPEQVRAGVEALVELAESRPDLFKAAFSRPALGARAPAGPRASAAPRRSGALGLSPRPVEQRLRALQAEGAIDPAIDPGVAARAFTEMQIAILCWWIDEPDRPPRTALVETLVRLHPAMACRAD
jgi:AcrR family transcriptional regulator